jgi:hypothetical protein
LVLSNGRLELVVDASRGGSITDLTGGPSGDRWLFRDASRSRGFPPDHPVYDDVWCGGFEELFPNDAACRFDGLQLPDHGELWNRPFEVLSATGTEVHLRRRCECVPADIDKVISLEPDRAAATILYRLENRAGVPLWFLFKLHPAMRVEAGDRVLLPGGSVTPVEPGFGALADSEAQAWPTAADLSLVRPAQERFREFVYVSSLPEGWCGIRRARTGESLVLSYPLTVFPYCWLFITYGGWQDYNTVVLEPCTNVPKDLAQARQHGTCAVLGPGEVREFSVRLEIRGA